MADDIVQRLRINADAIDWEQPLAAERQREAAAEIERLRAEIVTTRAERDHAQIQADHLAKRLVNEARRA